MWHMKAHSDWCVKTQYVRRNNDAILWQNIMNGTSYIYQSFYGLQAHRLFKAMASTFGSLCSFVQCWMMC